MRMLERLPAIVRIEICEQFDGADIVNVCEAMPNMKSVLKCLTVRHILRYCVRHMEWVDAPLCRMLQCTFAVTDGGEAKSVSEVESEVEMLCKKCQPCTKYVDQKPPTSDEALSYLTFCMIIDSRDFTIPSGNILNHWPNARGQRLQDYTTAYEARSDDHDLDEEGSTHRFRFVICEMESVLQRHSSRRLLHVLERLMAIVARIASDATHRPPLLLVSDAQTEETGRTMAACDHFECLETSLCKLNVGS
ncbi:unnamed protein product [Taenia asiatica]|uniref:F-box domain-containing protein n=1 Tax=Taenia asiatica TaxID=60517 RepID=A0A0R3WF52_TAEAS|nr:unnamed protein product [Taenia asiatica]